MEPRGTRLRRWITSSRAANGNQTGKTIPARCVAGTTPPPPPCCTAAYHQRATATTQLPAAGRELKPVGLHGDAPKKDGILATQEEARAQTNTFGGRAGFGSCAARIPNPPIPTPPPIPSPDLAPPPRGSIESAAAGRPAIRGRGDLAEVWAGLGWVGGSRGAMASAQAPSSSSAPSRKEHLEAGKKRVCLFVACW